MSRRKEAVRSRARGICEYCYSQESFATQSFSVEHIIPLQAGGGEGEENLAFACQGCNNHKYTRTAAIDPVTDELVRLFHPRVDRWDDHFIWSHDFTRIVGLTPSGRATVQVLQLNRAGLVNLRRALFRSGEHPPAHPGTPAE
jgi:5-methylcytosine-specific restriction endonuclease McrA